MLFQVEFDLAGYLGVLIDRQPDRSIIIKQESLANCVVEALFLNKNSVIATIVQTLVTAYLQIDNDGEPTRGLYSYTSVVSMLNHLQGHSRINITFKVSKVARYVRAPKQSHELALERHDTFTNSPGRTCRRFSTTIWEAYPGRHTTTIIASFADDSVFINHKSM